MILLLKGNNPALYDPMNRCRIDVKTTP